MTEICRIAKKSETSENFCNSFLEIRLGHFQRDSVMFSLHRKRVSVESPCPNWTRQFFRPSQAES